MPIAPHPHHSARPRPKIILVSGTFYHRFFCWINKKKLFCCKTYFCNIFRFPHIHHYIGRLHDLHGCSIWRTHGKCIRRTGHILQRNWPEHSLHDAFIQTELCDLHKWYNICRRLQSTHLFSVLQKRSHRSAKLSKTCKQPVEVFVKVKTNYKPTNSVSFCAMITVIENLSDQWCD